MKTAKEFEEELLYQEREYLTKLAYAKAKFDDLVTTFETCESILRGQRRGNKNCYSLVENSIFRGKMFFDKIKSIKEISVPTV